MAKHRLPPWLRPKSQPKPMRLGIVWYAEDQWRLVRDAAVDPDRFEATYPEWLAIAEDAKAQMLARGVVAEPFFVQASELLAWCLARGKPNEAGARAEYVSECLSAQGRGKV